MTRRDTCGALLASSERISLIITGTKALEQIPFLSVMKLWPSGRQKDRTKVGGIISKINLCVRVQVLHLKPVSLLKLGHSCNQ